MIGEVPALFINFPLRNWHGVSQEMPVEPVTDSSCNTLLQQIVEALVLV
jgi:hypothetical protein